MTGRIIDARGQFEASISEEARRVANRTRGACVPPWSSWVCASAPLLNRSETDAQNSIFQHALPFFACGYEPQTSGEAIFFRGSFRSALCGMETVAPALFPDSSVSSHCFPKAPIIQDPLGMKWTTAFLRKRRRGAQRPICGGERPFNRAEPAPRLAFNIRFHRSLAGNVERCCSPEHNRWGHSVRYNHARERVPSYSAECIEALGPLETRRTAQIRPVFHLRSVRCPGCQNGAFHFGFEGWMHNHCRRVFENDRETWIFLLSSSRSFEFGASCRAKFWEANDNRQELR